MAIKTSRKRTVSIAAVVLVLVLAGGYLLLWNRIRSSLEKVEAESKYMRFTLDDAVYEVCALPTVQSYVPELSAVTEESRGACVGEAEFQGEAYPLYRLSQLEAQGKRDGILVMERNGTLFSYELRGFESLMNAPDISAVCEAYGITDASDILSVTITEADGTPIDEMTDAEDLEAFYRKFTALGASLSDAEQAKAYYDVYAEQYGDTDDLTIAGGDLTANSDEASERAYTLWSEGMCVVGLRLKNGLRISDMVYAPVPKLFSVFGTYRLTEAFFS